MSCGESRGMKPRSISNLMPLFGLKLKALIAVVIAVLRAFSFSSCSGSSSITGVEGCTGVSMRDTLSLTEGSIDSLISSVEGRRSTSWPTTPFPSGRPGWHQFTKDRSVSTREIERHPLHDVFPGEFGLLLMVGTIWVTVSGGGSVPLICQSPPGLDLACFSS